jgi:deferrochelatase/peroxidase EfeB
MGNTNRVKMNDVQGLILRGYNFPNIRYIILSIKDTAGARKFCADLASGTGLGGLSVTNAEPWKDMIKPDYCLNIGFTYSGLENLIGKDYCDVVTSSSSAEVFGSFKNGAVNDADAIGDTGDSAPANWWKNGGWIPKNDPCEDGSDLHIQITLFTLTPQSREKHYLTLLGMISNTSSGPSVVPVYYQDSDPITVDGNSDYVHFGYRDSLSQPRIDGILWNEPKMKRLMGVSNIDDRPIVPVDRFVIGKDASDYYAHTLLTNGTFAAFRLLYQDEAKFNEFIHSGDDAPELIAAKICGRWRDGTPLAVSPYKEDKSLGEPGPKNFNFTNFNYLAPSPNQHGNQDGDESGLKCPYASHIRRANPRDDINVTDNDNDAQIHRIVRRASPYGPVYDPSEKGEVQRGLVGLFIGAVLDFQFRFVTQAWFELSGFRNPDASPNQSGVDPFFGPQVEDTNPGDSIFAYNVGSTYKEMPNGPNEPNLTRFIRTDGSLYLFLPGIAGLKYLSKGKIPPPLIID